MTRSPRNRIDKLRSILRSQAGVIDLGSIMIGVLITGMLAGAATASVLAVIPYAQNESAKSSLQSVRVAELSASIRDGKYKTYDQLVGAGHLQANGTLVIGLNSSSSCYVAGVLSASGTKFYVTSNGPEIMNDKAGPVDTAWCATVTVARGA